MPDENDIRWWKTSFGPAIAAATAGTPFDVDHLCAVACQETGYIWSKSRRADLPIRRVLELCVGDTIDYRGPKKGRQAFPRDKADLVGHAHGAEMFDVARAALEGVARYVDDYAKAAKNPNKFCRGFGMFQYDLQFFDADRKYFLEGGYGEIENTVRHCLDELKGCVGRLKLGGTGKLSDADFCKVAICYNTGRFNPSLGLKQGHFDGTYYYGERIESYLRLARSTRVVATDRPGRSTVVARGGLRLRQGPGIGFGVEKTLPLGTELWVVEYAGPDAAWAKVDLEGDGLFDGYVFAAFLSPQSETAEHAPEPH